MKKQRREGEVMMNKTLKQFTILVVLMLSVLAGCSNANMELKHNTSSSTISNEKAVETTKEKLATKAATETTAVPNQQMNTVQDNDLANLAYDGKNQVVTINNNHTTFSKEDLSLSKGNWQTFSNLDEYNRVGVANAMLSKSMMPKEKRERLHVNPTGWKNKQITVNGHREWLYNRCHLIGYQFTGENNNLKNLMTGTRSFNDPGMLYYENKVAKYLKTTGNHVRYQVEPIFKGNELVARGVHMQAKSIEDHQLEFNIYIFNVEQGVVINYADGTSKLQ